LGVSASEFRRQMDYLLRNRFEPVSASAVRDFFVRGTELPPRAFLVTFDDGYKNNLTVAAPILKSFGIPAIVFVSTGYIGNRRFYWFHEMALRILDWPVDRIRLPQDDSPTALPRSAFDRRVFARRATEQCKTIPNQARLEYLSYLRSQTPSRSPEGEEEFEAMTWDEVRALSCFGIEAGSHTVQHPILSQLSVAEAIAELRESKETIERELQSPCYALAYPNGRGTDYSAEVAASARAAGYALAFTGEDRPGGDTMSVGRVLVPGELPLSAFAARVSGARALISKRR
jgi:peptidoglycan/xylan/chitin deacetylase (PgdA/CDA1 family)